MSVRKNHKMVIACLIAGFVTSQLIAYACWWRIGHVYFSTDSDYWIVEYETDTGFRWEGRRFGCTAWVGSDWVSKPEVISRETQDGSITTVDFWGSQYGWPFRSVGVSGRTEKTNTITNGVWAIGQEQIAMPAPAWYHLGIPTGIRDRFLATIPIQIHPLGMFANTILYGLLMYGLYATSHRVIHKRRARRGLCPHCRYNIRGLPTCPECGQTSTPNAE